MFEPSSIFMIVILLIVLCFLLIFRNLEKKKESDKNKTNKDDSATAKKQKISRKVTKNFQSDPMDVNKYDAEVNDNVPKIQINEDEESNSFSTAKKSIVSSESIDILTKFNVFKELGYANQAADILANMLDTHKEYRTADYIQQLSRLYIETNQIDLLASILENYNYLLDSDTIKSLLTGGFKSDPTNFRLQLFVSKILALDPVEFGAEIIVN